jgi:uncharacterized protein (DUF1330 family)
MACHWSRGNDPASWSPLLISSRRWPRGLESCLQYGREVAPHLQRVGATLRYAGAAPRNVIGDGERPWSDAILIVEYPNPQAFIDMVTTPEYVKVHEHRTAGLERGDLIATSVWSVSAV